MEGSEESRDEPSSKHRLENVKLVTQEDVDNGRYSIEEVVLPLPGSQMQFPTHSTSKVL